ncbi:MAG: inorganic diphosphatase [Acidimicrobiia bacterium]|nr:inorganic diphosphatase [Acidimicrobiia bacterium]
MVITMVVEIPKGSRNKYEMDEESGQIYLDRLLFTATRYPADYGFIPDTLAADGDALDAMALVTEPTFPGCRIRIRPLGVFLMEDQGLADHKILGVPDSDPMWADAKDLSDVPAHMLRELEHFFAVYKDLEDKKTATIGWQPLADALTIIEQARID